MKAACAAVLALAAAWALAAALTELNAPRHILLPVLMYHTSSEEEPAANAGLYVKPSVFRAQMEWLLESGYTFCTFGDLPNLRKIRNPVLVTFDDGYPENYTEIFPIVRELGIKITVFVFNDTPLPAGWMREMAASGLVFFESHGETHTDMTTLDRDALKRELTRSAAWIEEVTGRAPVALAYPYGLHSAAVRRAARAQFSYGAAIGGRTHSTAQNPMTIRRHTVPRSMGMDEFMKLFG